MTRAGGGVEQESVLSEAKDAVLLLLDGQRHAVFAEDVQEVLRAVAITRLPGAPELLEGVIDRRGVVTPVIDLRRRLGMPPKRLAASDHLVIVRAGGRVVALRADAAVDLLPLRAEDFDTEAAKAPFVRGAWKRPDGLVLLYDLATFLSPTEAAAIDLAVAATT